MSAYKNFVHIFPKRCSDLLKTYRMAKWADLEVTLMLSLAAAGLTIPLERLDKKRHPYPFHDSIKYHEAKVEFDELLVDNFCGSTLLKEHPRSWCFGRLATTTGDPDTWPELNNPTPISQNITVVKLIKHLRNAIAHGSIHTKGDPISKIVFVASLQYGSVYFNYLTVSPDDFYNFLLKWFKFLNALPYRRLGKEF
jgi:hypothetical protein